MDTHKLSGLTKLSFSCAKRVVSEGRGAAGRRMYGKEVLQAT
jgi:hypothetical protein